MSQHDIFRYVLLIAIGITVYFMARAWVDDSRERNISLNEPPVPPIVSDQTFPDDKADNSDIPTATTNDPEVTTSDVPDASLIPPPTTETGIGQQVESQQLITVETPVLIVSIDPVGGDVVSAKLPTYPIDISVPDQPTKLLDQKVGRVYVAQSGLIGQDGLDQSSSRPIYRVMKTKWELQQGTLEVPLVYERDGITVTKTYVFSADKHDVLVRYVVANETTADLSMSFFAQLKRDSLPPEDQHTGFFRPRAYLGAAVSTNEKNYRKLKFKEIAKRPYQEIVNGGWVAILQHYFLSAWIPGDPAVTYRYFGNQDQNGHYRFGFTGPAKVITPNTEAAFSAVLYMGPKRQSALNALAPHLDLTVDYGFLWWLSIPIFKVLAWIQSIVVNWGVAIILLTILIKTVLFPLSAMSYRSMAKMRKLAPQIKRLQERFGSDRQKMGQEMMAMYRKEKANPFSGCLPLLLQMPVFFALYWVLIESVELRQAPFMLWIQDLGAMDPWLILPILNGVSMFLMQRLNPPMADPMQQKVMMFMPIMFGLICVFMPAGLVLYWFINNLYSMAHHYYALRKAGAT
ncbi:MAG: membrane protein insertase YidC [Gammaproteobacteria bacterium]|nr:membrane protein insertase YidC [Gammaproteobacteria bacterium]